MTGSSLLQRCSSLHLSTADFNHAIFKFCCYCRYKQRARTSWPSQRCIANGCHQPATHPANGTRNAQNGQNCPQRINSEIWTTFQWHQISNQHIARGCYPQRINSEIWTTFEWHQISNQHIARDCYPQRMNSEILTTFEWHQISNQHSAGLLFVRSHSV